MSSEVQNDPLLKVGVLTPEGQKAPYISWSFLDEANQQEESLAYLLTKFLDLIVLASQNQSFPGKVFYQEKRYYFEFPMQIPEFI